MLIDTQNIDLATLLNRTYQEKKTQIEGMFFHSRAENTERQPGETEPLSVQLVRACREESANRWNRFFKEGNQ